MRRRLFTTVLKRTNSKKKKTRQGASKNTKLRNGQKKYRGQGRHT